MSWVKILQNKASMTYRLCMLSLYVYRFRTKKKKEKKNFKRNKGNLDIF